MDVFKKAVLISLFLTMVSCGKDNAKDPAEDTLGSQCKKGALPNEYIVKYKNGDYALLKNVSTESFQSTLSLYADLVDYIEPNYSVPVSEAIVEHDIAPTNWGANTIGAKYAWDRNILGEGVIVAVVDSGVDTSHTQLSHNIWINNVELLGSAGVDDDGNGYVDDVKGWNFSNNTPSNLDEIGHGTHVAGVIAADGNLGSVQGISPKAKIMAIDFMNENGGTDFEAARALDYAKNMKANIINASWGSSSCSNLVKEKIEELNSSGVFLSVAAGNSGNDISIFPEYPAALDTSTQLTIGATTKDFFRALFSNYGMLVHVVAPGKEILSTVPTDISPSGTAVMSGTSMAAPFAAGLAALLKSHRPLATAQNIKNIIETTVQAGNFNVRFDGEINVPKAIVQLEEVLP